MSTATTMTSTIPRPPRPPFAPPTGPLPALPVPKTRALSSDASALEHRSPESRRSSTASQLPAPPSRKIPTPSRSLTTSGLPTPKATRLNTAPAGPTLNTTDIPSPSPSSPAPSSALPRTVRKVTSIGSFPLPPKGSTPRVASLPPSPLSASTSSNEQNAAQALHKARRDSSKHRSVESGVKKARTSRSSGYGVRTRTSGVGTPSAAYSPSLLNGNVESSLVSANESAKQHDSLLSPPSPPQSRSSSANDSYGGEDNGDEQMIRGRSRNNDATLGSRRDSDLKDTKGNVLVSVRVRPEAGGDNNDTEGEWLLDGKRSLISYRGREGGDYRFDNVFTPQSHNGQVYNHAARRLVRRVMAGYHGTVFAYGMTGTGKTFSMQGTASSPGVIPLAINDIFSYIRENPNREFLLRVSYLEIYNEKIFDLLSQSSPGQVQTEEIKLREDSKRGVYATPLKEEIVQSPNQLLRVIARGDSARRTGSTQFNARSSRSHAVVQIVVESRERTPSNGAYFEKETRRADRIMPGGVLVSTLSLIDLAGSEKAAENKERRTEGAHINKSLLTLGTVIARLSGDDEKDEKDGATKDKEKDKDKGLKHLPYRDSKLTRLLQPALSGNSLVSILCTIQLSSAGTSAAQSSSHAGETLNTLKFASRAKNNIVSHAKRNESNPNSGDPNSRALLDRYRLEIQDLRAQLDKQNNAKEEAEKREEKDEIEEDIKREQELEREEATRHEEQMLEMQLARTALKERISHLNRLILSSKSLGVNSGRFSSASVQFNPRLSTYSVATEFGRPVSVRDEHARDSNRDSATTLDVPSPQEGNRTSAAMSAGSVVQGMLPNAAIGHMVSEETANADDEDEDAGGIDGEGNASQAQQIRMLQADLADKNRYIATLEKRLLQARRTSHSRVSMHFASRVGLPEEGTLEGLLRERDREIEELRASLDDQMRMVTALRSAARRTDGFDRRKSYATTASEDTARPTTSGGGNATDDSVGDLTSLQFRRHNSSRLSNRTSNASLRLRNGSAAGHRSNPSTASRSSTGAPPINFSKHPLSPTAILGSPTHSSTPSRDGIDEKVQPGAGMPRRRSVDEMTMLLDQMIQDKVESGHVVRGDRGSLRVRHDTVLQGIGSDLQGSAVEEEEGEFDEPPPQKQVPAEKDALKEEKVANGGPVNGVAVNTIVAHATVPTHEIKNAFGAAARTTVLESTPE